MTHSDHVNLIRKAIPQGRGVWAELGSGWGAFTFALRDLAGPEIEIYSIDRNKDSLKVQQSDIIKRFPNSNIHFLNKDFTEELNLFALDGILMANSLHYVKDQKSFLKHIQKYLKPGGKVVIVEYDTGNSNAWIPYPLSYATLINLAKESGFANVNLLETKPLQPIDMYSAELILI